MAKTGGVGVYTGACSVLSVYRPGPPRLELSRRSTLFLASIPQVKILVDFVLHYLYNNTKRFDWTHHSK